MSHQVETAERHAGEMPFQLEELFYSRTDTRGVILSGNEVFRRVSGFEWGDLLGAPHKIVRHPDTPRAVFRILWDAIQKGYPMGAYVKNRSKSGGWYWVFAIVLPIDGGFLSVRLKPVSDLSDKMRRSYATFSERERVEKIDPEESAGMLRRGAEADGFSSYTNFMAHALGHELAARDRQLRRTVDPRTQVLAEMNTAMVRATKEQVGLLRSFEALQSVPNNMRIVASRLEPSGGPVSAISENYKASSVVISDRLRSFVAGEGNICDQMSREVARALFLLGSSRVLSEMNAKLEQVVPVEGIDWVKERELLNELEQKASNDARAVMGKAAAIAAQLTQQSREIRRQMLGLDTIRVLGRVECGRMRDNSGGLSATIDQLDGFHDDIKGRLESIMRLSEEIEQAMTRYLRQSKAA
ncbi:PAS domain-containing protein [Thioclava sp. 15-R06ZXC-3]|uniref:PAS domain-containing protein n=1 Tax=Thioclava arctica TaxID=3238301 RepID=A0ABV3TGH4_9RHOB